MPDKITTQELPDFDMAQYLKTEADIVEYLRQVMEEAGDSAELASALGHIAKARGMTEIAKAVVFSEKLCIKLCVRTVSRVLKPYSAYVKPWE